MENSSVKSELSINETHFLEVLKPVTQKLAHYMHAFIGDKEMDMAL